MEGAYIRLHELGYAHSVESYRGGELVGGLYGVSIGRVFFGESMFARQTDASKVAFMALVARLLARGYPFIDSQVSNPLTLSLGAEEWPRHEYLSRLALAVASPGEVGKWTVEVAPAHPGEPG
jgi:leucyl/phenylalanyl-tRNA--protein transferase